MAITTISSPGRPPRSRSASAPPPEGNFAPEPVLWGNDATVMSFGPASRWAVDAGIAAEVRPTQHISWFARRSTTGLQLVVVDTARGAGGAVDGYPSGMLSLGAKAAVGRRCFVIAASLHAYNAGTK